MNFFKQISELLQDDVNLTLSIKKINGSLCVSVHPRSNKVKDEAQNMIQPLILNGSAEEMDNEFINAISGPVAKTTSIITNMREYEVAAQEADKKSKAAEALKKEKDDKRKKSAEFVKKADDAEKTGNDEKALEYLNKAIEVEENEKLTKRINALEAKLGQKSLFDIPQNEGVGESVENNDDNQEENNEEE